MVQHAHNATTARPGRPPRPAADVDLRIVQEALGPRLTGQVLASLRRLLFSQPAAAGETLLTVAEFARQGAHSVRAVRARCRAGVLGSKRGNSYVIPARLASQPLPKPPAFSFFRRK